jgi:hypothetical protein
MNMKHLDYKQKTKLLLAVSGLTLLLCYKLAFQHTISLYLQFSRNNVPEEELQTRLKNYDRLVQRNVNLDKLISTSGNRTYEHQILESMTRYCTKYHVALKNYTPFNGFSYENMYVSTQKFTIEGKFQHMLRCINDLESDSIPLKIAAIAYKVSSTHENDTPHLTANLYLQQLSANESTHEY